MASSFKTPPPFAESKPYARWIEEVKMWQSLTDLPPKKQGLAIALSLPENEGTIRDKVFSELGVDILHADDGAKLLIQFMDGIYKKDELSSAYEVYTEFDRFKKASNMDMDTYVSEFEKLYNKTQKFQMTLPVPVLAFKLLENACLDHKERQLVITGVDYNDRDNLFKQMSQSLKKFFGRQSMPQNTGQSLCPSIKIEPTYNAEHFQEDESAYYTRNDRGRRQRRGPYGYRRPQANNRRFESGKFNRRQQNPMDAEGRVMKCKICESIFHFARECPDSYENMEKKKKESNVEEFALFTGDNVTNLQILVGECVNAAVLDSGCSSTVAGERWMKCYLESLSEEQKRRVKKTEGKKTYKFGAGELLQSIECITFPCKIAGVPCTITTDIVRTDIPLLLGRPSMKAAKMILDHEHDRAFIFGREVDLQYTSSGHYCVLLQETETSVNEIFINSHTEKDKRKTVEKLHKQFAHPSVERLRSLMDDAGILDKEYKNLIEAVSGDCDVCVRFKKPMPRPVVGMPIATDFNDVVAMDLTVWKNGVYILHLIDIATRFSLAAVIKNKTPECIVDNIVKVWIGSGLGAPRKFLADNGGEFANMTFKDVAENLNVEVCNTAGMSPWQNGICERNHAVVDSCVRKIMTENPETDLETALIWAVNAKNSLQMVHGWSPYQLVFGKNPNLPSVLHDKPPALGGTTASEKFAKHLNALHSARRSFIQSESSERIRRALRHNIRHHDTVFETGSKVYYQRDNQWKGPGRVIGQDGKVVFVRHGSVYVRVHPCRLLKVGCEFGKGSQNELSGNSNVEDESPVDSGTIPITCMETDDARVQDKCAETEMQSESLNADPCPMVTNEFVSTQKSIQFPKMEDKIKYMVHGTDSWKEAEVISRGGKATGKYKTWFNIKDVDSVDIKAVDFDKDMIQWEKIDHFTQSTPTEMKEKAITENVNVTTTACETENVIAAKKLELENWKLFDVYEEVDDCGQAFISTRWVITEKAGEKKHVKARLVARGFEEEENIQSDSPTAGKDTLRVFLAITSGIASWEYQTIDIKAAFLQGKTIDREVYLRPPDDVYIEGRLWKLKKCVYGLNDAARTWYFRVCEELKTLGCKQSEIDPALFYMHKDNQLCGLFLMHVDDFIWSGKSDFETLMIDKLCSVFKVGKQGSGELKYIGLEISKQDKMVTVDQHSYVDNLPTLPTHSNRSMSSEDPLDKEQISVLRSLIGQIGWVSNQTRPDVSFDLLELSISMKHPKVEHLSRARKTVKKLKNDQCQIVFPLLGTVDDLRLALFCDASHANLCDGVSSGGGFIIFLTGKGDMCCPLTWKSQKIKRVVRSTLAAETLAMVDGLESTCYLGCLLSEVLFNSKQNKIPIDCFTDNKSLLENVHSTKLVYEKRLRIDIATIKQMLQNGEISSVKWIESSRQISDCLTKRGASSLRLMDILKTGRLIV